MVLINKLPEIIYIIESRIKNIATVNITIHIYKCFNLNSLTNAGGVVVYVLTKLKIFSVSKQELDIEGYKNFWLSVKIKDTNTKLELIIHEVLQILYLINWTTTQ